MGKSMEYWAEILSFIGGVISGAIGGSLLTVNLQKRNTAKKGSTVIDQSDARAGGDVVGGNKTIEK